jgi:hypothetical protein
MEHAHEVDRECEAIVIVLSEENANEGSGECNVCDVYLTSTYMRLICKLDTVALHLPHQLGDDHIDTEELAHSDFSATI